MNRRSIITILIGAIATLSGFAVTALLRQRRCAGAGGQWVGTARECVLASGDRVAVSTLTDVFLGVTAAILLAFMLFRVLLFVMGRMPRRTP
jgi:hypothetical protein